MWRRAGALVRNCRAVSGTAYLLLDHSTSMADDGKLAQVKRGALRFFGEAWLRGYAVGAVGFSSRARCLHGATQNFYSFQRRVAGLRAEGRTAMTSALRLGARRLRRCRGGRVLVLITDGQPDHPEAARSAALSARAQGAELIVIGTGGADLDFLASLTPRPELARFVSGEALEQELAATALELPGAVGGRQ